MKQVKKKQAMESPCHPVTLSPCHPVTLSPCHPVTVALLGNPNTGKTTLFNALAGMRQRVGNYPGVTVETKKGRMTHQGQVFHVVDLPGTYSLAPRSPDEMVAVDLILGHQAGEERPDVIVAIVDASNLERNLYLTTQAMEVGVPVVIALNMIDVAERQGLRIDTERLARQLGMPVVPIQANKRKGLDRLKQAVAEAVVSAAHWPEALARENSSLANASGQCCSGQWSGVSERRNQGTWRAPPFPEAFEREATALHDAIGDSTPPFLVRRLLLDVGGHTERCFAERNGANLSDLVKAARERLAAAGCAVPAVEARTRYAWIRQATADCILRPEQRPVIWTDRLDRVLTHKALGHDDLSGADGRRVHVDLLSGRPAHEVDRKRQERPRQQAE